MSENNKTWQNYTHKVARGIRRRALEHTISCNGGYLSQACSSAEIFSILYTHLMNLEPSQAPMIPLPFPGVPGPNNPEYFTGVAYNGPKAPHLDRFFISCVQYAIVLYATLVETGRMAEEGLKMFNKDGGTVEMIGAEHSPGHEITAGSLGQALSQAAGISLARKLKNESGRQWVFMSDGEFQSGQTWETIQAMVFHKIDNILIYVDVNGQQCDGKMEDVMKIEPLKDRLEAFGARTFKIDGHNLDELEKPAKLPSDGRPTFVLAYTDTAKDMPILEPRRPKLHYVRFKNPEERNTFKNYLEDNLL